MDFIRRDITKMQRNGDIYISSKIISNSSYGGSSGGGSSSSGGNYLPATQNADGTYTVNLTQVTFNGNVIAQGEVAAYQSGTSEASSGTAITVYDGLDSDSALIALSANQGRILKELIQSMGSGGTSINIIIDEDSLADNQILVYNATTKQWVNKANEGISEISKLKDVSLSNLSNNQILQYNSTTSKWENKNFNTEISALTEHLNDTVKHITTDERNKWNSAVTSSHTHSNKTVLDKITDTKLTNWDGVVTNWNKAFYFDSNGNLRVKLNLIGDEEISAYGSGTSTSSGAITIVDSLNSTLTDAALSANQGRVLKSLIDSANFGDFDLSDYSKTSHTHSNYSVTSHTHSNYSTTSHTHTDYSKTGHTHSYTSTVKLGTTSYNVSDNTISLPAYPTLSTLGAASSTDLGNHTANTTAHITSTERTNWNTAYNNNHTHSNKSVIDGITTTKITNWDKVVTDWGNIFEIDSNGNLKVKVNLYGQGEISAFGSGATGGNTDINLGNYYTKEQIDGMFDSMGGTIDLSDYSKTSHTHSNYSTTGHTHSIANITNLQSSLDAKSGTGHTHSAYSPTGHSHSNYSLTSHTHSAYASSSHTHSISNITNLQSTLDGKSGTGHSHNNYSLTSHTHSNYSLTSHTHNYAAASHTHTYSQITDAGTYVYDATLSRTKNTILAAPNGSDGKATFRSLVAADIPTLAISKISNLQSSLDAKSGTGHTHNYAGSSSAGGAATSANKVNSTLTFTGGTFAVKTFNGSSATTVNIPTHTSHITNNSGFITTAATVANANYATSAGSATNATTASKLSTVSKTAWGQTFWTSGGIPTSISGNMTGVGSISASGNITTSAEVTAHSDKRLKSNIKPLNVRGELNPVTYIKDGKESIGFIAQEVQELYPELVIEDNSTDERYLSLNYQQLTAVLYAEIKELRKEITELKNKHKWL